MGSTSRVRAWRRLAVFAVGSWLIVARAGRALLSGFPGRWRRTAPHVSRWARLGARCLGIRVSSVGELPPPGSLVVANHQGYADVVTLGGLFPVVFLARHDMRGWPMFGALAASGATIFINRELKRAGARGIALATRALAAGAAVAAFPEGTVNESGGLLPFRSGVFQAAVDSGANVVPAAIRYVSLDGDSINEENRDVVGWFHSVAFLQHLLRLASHRRVEAEVHFGSPISSRGRQRRELATRAEDEVRNLLRGSAGERARLSDSSARGEAGG